MIKTKIDCVYKGDKDEVEISFQEDEGRVTTFAIPRGPAMTGLINALHAAMELDPGDDWEYHVQTSQDW